MRHNKQASEKPEDMSDALWKIFMAHKGESTQDDSAPTIGSKERIVYTRRASAAEIADVIHAAETKKSLLAQDYTEERAVRLAKGKEGGV